MNQAKENLDLNLASCKKVSPNKYSRPRCFEPTSVLFAGSGYNDQYDIVLDKLQVAMLDGRTIHFHFQFVEPELLARYPEAECCHPEILKGALSPFLFLLCKQPSFAEMYYKKLEGGYGSEFAVYASSEYADFAIGSIKAALGKLAEVGLDWLPTLSIGAFQVSDCFYDLKEYQNLALIDLTNSHKQAIAENIITQSAKALAYMWIEAEWLCGKHMKKNYEAAREFSGKTLALLLLTEFRSRTGSDINLSLQIDERENVLADFPLTRHLINFWDPRWCRQAFLSGSDFDYAQSLHALYEGWKA